MHLLECDARIGGGFFSVVLTGDALVGKWDIV